MIIICLDDSTAKKWILRKDVGMFSDLVAELIHSSPINSTEEQGVMVLNILGVVVGVSVASRVFYKIELLALYPTGFGFIVLLLDWLWTKAEQQSLLCYLTHRGEER